MWSHRLVAAIVSLSVIAGACASAEAFPVDHGLRNTVPRLTSELVVAAGPGRAVSVALPAVDDDGDPITIEADGPADMSVTADRFDRWQLRWAPTATGTSTASLTLRDGRGGVSEAEIELRSTNSFRADALLGLGDSVASGHGLQKRDYLGRDGCWRSEREAYPWLVREGLVARGDLDHAGDYGLVACSGATVADLLDQPVTGGLDGSLPAGERRLSQVDWAIAANPEILTLTVGANTLEFTDLSDLVVDAGVDRDELGRRLRRVEEGLDIVLRRLVDHTDSTVYVTNYYNPTANDPQGIDGCRGDCFRARADEVVEAFNGAVTSVVADQPADRVVLVDLATRFDGHGAPNGLGPDGLRSGASGLLGGLVGAPLEGVHPYCARGHDDDASWVNYVDCVHPDGRGHREIAAAILEAAA